MAEASPRAHCASPDAGGVVVCEVEDRRVRLVAGDGTAGSGWPPPGWRLIHYPWLETDDPGPCIRHRSRWIEPDERDPTKELEDQFDEDVANLGEEGSNLEDCPPIASDQPPDTGEVIEEFLGRVVARLPEAEPEVPPGGQALTGLAAYLVTAERSLHLDVTESLDLAAGAVTANATGEGAFSVDWGDGTEARGPYDFVGRPYPDGEVVHVYDHTGEVEVQVTDHWAFELRVPGLPPLDLDFEVDAEPLKVLVEQLLTVRLPTS